MQKSKNQKEGAWLLLADGPVALAVTGATSAGVDFQGPKKSLQ